MVVDCKVSVSHLSEDHDAAHLTACDAAYLWLAGALKAPLATFDARLLTAAQQYLPTLE